MTRCVSFAERGKRLLARLGLDGAPVTASLFVANVVVFAVQVAYLQATRLPPALRTEEAELGRLQRAYLAFGANYAPFVFGELRLETLLTSCFVHFSVLHIALNMAALAQMGGVVERTVGHARLATMYVVSGIAGAGASAAWGWLATEPERLSAGASGAICGVLGAALVLGVRIQGMRGPIVRQMFLWLTLTIGLGFFIGSDNAAHVAGTAAGAAFAILWRPGVVYSPLVARALVLMSLGLVPAAWLTVLAHDLRDPWATLGVPARIALARLALDQASCADALRATARAADIAPRSAAVRDLKQRIVVGCRPSETR